MIKKRNNRIPNLTVLLLVDTRNKYLSEIFEIMKSIASASQFSKSVAVAFSSSGVVPVASVLVVGAVFEIPVAVAFFHQAWYLWRQF